MLMLLFFMGEERYACICDPIVEIIPQVPLRKITQAPDYMPGLLNYGGMPVPVVDFTHLLVGRPSVPYLSTRVILFRREQDGGHQETLGVLAERVTDTIDREPSEFVNSGFNLRESRFIGGVVNDPQGLIYHVLVNELFDTVHKVLSPK